MLGHIRHVSFREVIDHSISLTTSRLYMYTTHTNYYSIHNKRTTSLHRGLSAADGGGGGVVFLLTVATSSEPALARHGGAFPSF